MATIGALVLHGFTSSLDTVNALSPHLEKAGIPYRMPLLRGHGQTPEALRGVKARDWVDDAASALADLLREADKAIVIGLSMGGLVGLTLAIEQPDRLAGLVTVAAAMRWVNPLAPFCGLLSFVLPRFASPKPPSYENYVCTNYTWFPTKTFVELYYFGREIEASLSEVKVPLLVMGSERDTIIQPEASWIIYQRTGSTNKEIRMFQKTGHEMMQGCEKEEVFAAIMTFIESRRSDVIVPQVG
ncbi:MAG: alpha/beta fold hydrolase [Cyanobacteria bacterium NC_groundwater_1444_Ag_S-0.65um_54_12]|nr:alpha/beta fold hydrolase [Cyanobacteria bacterium NC_groundwater_1444_Ag_S-0.65um_54_12]